MKHLSRALLDLLKATLLLAVIGIGASTLSARYSTSVVSAPSWTPPSANPPNNNAPAPINVSMNAQQKSGSLILGTTAGVNFDDPVTSLDVFGLASTTILSTDYLLVGKDFTYAKGTNLAGKVLTSDASGTASWQTPTGGGAGGSCDYILVRKTGNADPNNFAAFTAYQNTTGSALFVTAWQRAFAVNPGDDGSSVSGYISANGTTWQMVVSDGGPTSTTRGSISFIVPNNYWYKLQSDVATEHNFGDNMAQAWKMSCGGGSSSTKPTGKMTVLWQQKTQGDNAGETYIRCSSATGQARCQSQGMNWMVDKISCADGNELDLHVTSQWISGEFMGMVYNAYCVAPPIYP